MAHCHRNDCKLHRYADDSEVFFCKKCGKYFRGNLYQSEEIKFNPLALLISLIIGILIFINLHHENIPMPNKPHITENNNQN